VIVKTCTPFRRFHFEDTTLEYFTDLGYSHQTGPTIAPGELQAEREDYHEVILADRLRSALLRLNPNLPAEPIEEALRKIIHLSSPALVSINRSFHHLLVNGVEVEYSAADGQIVDGQVQMVDFDNPENNDWLVVNQFTVVQGPVNRRPDVVIFLNDLPLGVIVFKKFRRRKGHHLVCV
jgi:type I restriction enzyme R subunit